MNLGTQEASASLVIREARREDAAEIQAIYAPYVLTTATSFEEEPPDVEQMRARIDESHVWLVCTEAGSLLGYAYASPFHPRPAYRWAVEVSIYLRGEAGGRGLGRLLLDELLFRLRERGFVSAFAGTTLPNEASVKLFEGAGFHKVAHWSEVGYKLGSWHDVGWWQLHLRDRGVPPADPTV
jgi:L-amino acid N-acyltransferase YncA